MPIQSFSPCTYPTEVVLKFRSLPDLVTEPMRRPDLNLDPKQTPEYGVTFLLPLPVACGRFRSA